MAGEVKDECGIAAVYLNRKEDTEAPVYLYRMLLSLQHRGQLSAGITTYNPHRPELLSTYKDLGTVNEAFRTHNPNKTRKLFEKYEGTRGIGHVRYATFGKEDREHAHPIERHHGRTWKWFSFAFNGNLANSKELKQTLERWQYHLKMGTDSEMMMHFITRGLRRNNNMKPAFPAVFSYLSERFDGSYNITLINADGDVVAVRDPLGFRPLAYTVSSGRMFAASESNALVNLGLNGIKSLEPGKMIIANDSGISIKRFAKPKRKAHCMFEWVYFANVSSVLEDKSVYLTRLKLGKQLAKMETENVNDDYIVVGVPDTSKPAADGFAYEIGLPSKEGLIRNRHVGRTFIDGKIAREDKVQLKFTPLKEVVKGKKLLVVDDSVVRGNTSKRLVNFLKKTGGAKEVHLRVTCPPIARPCFYGIDMSTMSELIASRHVKDVEKGITEKETEEIRKEIGADSLIYQTVPNLVKCIGLPKRDLCMACLNGKYPTPCGTELCELAKRCRSKRSDKRMYEQF